MLQEMPFSSKRKTTGTPIILRWCQSNAVNMGHYTAETMFSPRKHHVSTELKYHYHY